MIAEPLERDQLRAAALHEGAHALVSLALGARVEAFRVSPSGRGVVRVLAPTAQGRVLVALAGWCAEALAGAHGDNWAAFSALNAHTADVQNARRHARFALAELGRRVDDDAVEAECSQAWSSVQAWLRRPAVWAALEAIRDLALERFVRAPGAPDVLSPADAAELDAIVAPLTPHQIVHARKHPDTPLTENGTITRAAKEHRMNTSQARSRLQNLGVHPSRLEALAVDLARAGNGAAVLAHLEAAGAVGLGVLGWPAGSEPRPSAHVAALSSTPAPNTRTAPPSTSAVTASQRRILELAGIVGPEAEAEFLALHREIHGDRVVHETSTLAEQDRARALSQLAAAACVSPAELERLAEAETEARREAFVHGDLAGRTDAVYATVTRAGEQHVEASPGGATELTADQRKIMKLSGFSGTEAQFLAALNRG